MGAHVREYPEKRMDQFSMKPARGMALEGHGLSVGMEKSM